MVQEPQAEIEELKAAERMKSGTAKAKHIKIVRLRLEGYTIKQVAQMTDCSRRTVYTWQKKYEAEGLNGLAIKPKPQAEIEELIAAERMKSGTARAKHIKIIRLRLEGYTIQQVMQMVCCSMSTVYTWQNKYEAEGLNGLVIKPKLQVDIEEIKAAERIESGTAKAKRIKIIRLRLEGYTIQQVMQMVGCSMSTVYTCQKKYEAEGLNGLATKPKSAPKPGSKLGGNKKLTEEQERVLYETIKTELPNEVGFAPFPNWTVSLAKRWISQTFGVTYSESGVRYVLGRLGFSYTSPTWTIKQK